jgi:hypothetical protein
MKKLRITDKVLTLATFEKVVRSRQQELETDDIDVLALQFMNDCRDIYGVSAELSGEFHRIYGNDGMFEPIKAARNFVNYVLHGSMLY